MSEGVLSARVYLCASVVATPFYCNRGKKAHTKKNKKNKKKKSIMSAPTAGGNSSSNDSWLPKSSSSAAVVTPANSTSTSASDASVLFTAKDMAQLRQNALDAKAEANGYFLKGNFEIALPIYELALREAQRGSASDVELARIHSNIAGTHFKLRNYTESENHARTCTRLAPFWTKSHLRLAAACLMQDLGHKALTASFFAMAIDRQQVDARESVLNAVQCVLNAHRHTKIITVNVEADAGNLDHWVSAAAVSGGGKKKVQDRAHSDTCSESSSAAADGHDADGIARNRLQTVGTFDCCSDNVDLTTTPPRVDDASKPVSVSGGVPPSSTSQVAPFSCSIWTASPPLGCTVCQMLLIDPVTHLCGHSSCRVCLASMRSCPVPGCGLPVYARPRTNLVLKAMIAAHQSSIKSGSSSLSSPRSPPPPFCDQLKVLARAEENFDAGKTSLLIIEALVPSLSYARLLKASYELYERRARQRDFRPYSYEQQARPILEALEVLHPRLILAYARGLMAEEEFEGDEKWMTPELERYRYQWAMRTALYLLQHLCNTIAPRLIEAHQYSTFVHNICDEYLLTVWNCEHAQGAHVRYVDQQCNLDAMRCHARRFMTAQCIGVAAPPADDFLGAVEKTLNKLFTVMDCAKKPNHWTPADCIKFLEARGYSEFTGVFRQALLSGQGKSTKAGAEELLRRVKAADWVDAWQAPGGGSPDGEPERSERCAEVAREVLRLKCELDEHTEAMRQYVEQFANNLFEELTNPLSVFAFHHEDGETGSQAQGAGHCGGAPSETLTGGLSRRRPRLSGAH